MSTCRYRRSKPQRLYRQIADQIARLIERGEYKPGERLPPERDLAKQLGVSRPSVREALIALEVEGYVDVRVGSGVYVRGPAGRARKRARLAADSGPFELINARWLIESECAALAAKNATPAQIKRDREALDAMNRDRKRNVMPLDADRLFHLRIAEAGGNSALALRRADALGPAHRARSSCASSTTSTRPSCGTRRSPSIA